MRRHLPPPRRLPTTAIVLLVALVVAACEATTGPTPQATGTPTPAATTGPIASESPTTAPPATPSATPSSPSSPPSALSGVTPGALAVTVSDRLRVRSAPRVAADSLRYTPLLPAGTQLVVTAGPVRANDYDWVRVAPVGVKLDDGVDQGWVAIADHDGTPWVTIADDPTPGFELAAATTDPLATSMTAAKAQAAAANRFGIALYRRLRTGELADRGIVFSPYSIATALAMARAGAAGNTATEMDAVLRVPGWGALARGTASLSQVLASRDGAWEVTADDGGRDTHFLSLRSANMAFAQRGYPLEDAYLRRISSAFRSGFGLVDYVGDAGAAREAINGWVSRQTVGRIPSLLLPPDVTPATRLVLVNAVYFKGEWLVRFMEGSTQPASFATPSGTVQVPTMEAWGEQAIPYVRATGYRATELRYQGPDPKHPLAMTIVMPDDLAAFERSLSPSVLAKVTARLATESRRLQVISDPPEAEACPTYPYSTRLFLPKFGIETRADLIPMLQALGMHDAFVDGVADFSGMTTADRLHIGMVIHQANIDVDERGTEAAAATAIGMDTGGCTGPVPLKDRVFRVNHPFLFFIRDQQTGAILFMGRVLDPTAR